MKELNLKSLDVTRLYSMRKFAETFGIAYGSVYAKYNTSRAGRARDPFITVVISDNDFIYVSPEKEKELLSKKKGRK